MFENPVFIAGFIFAGFAWLGVAIIIGFVLLKRVPKRPEFKITTDVIWEPGSETAPKGRFSEIQDAIRRSQV